MHTRLEPKLVTVLREGYSWRVFLSDLGAGVTVGIVALPLAIAFAIASGVKPEQGLYTAIVAGFVIAALGGSRAQISGPTGAFIVIIYSVVQQHGYEGLAVATLIAGALLVAMGLARMGALLKFIPYPVTVGFTGGIAIIIFSSQIRDFLGLTLEQVIERATANPARTFAFPKGLGTLREGAEADIAVLSIAEGDFDFVDALRVHRIGHRKIVPAAVVKAGRIYGSASIPVVHAR